MPFDPNAFTSDVGRDAYASMQPIAKPYDAARGYPLAVYLDAIGRMFQPAEDVVRDPDKLLHPDFTLPKWLPWLSQFNGSGVPPGGSGDITADRDRIKNPPKQGRGTVPNILAEVGERLTGNKKIYYIERGVGGSAYRGSISTLVSETPDTEHLILVNLGSTARNSANFVGQSLTAGPTGDFISAIPATIPSTDGMYLASDIAHLFDGTKFSTDALDDGMYLTFPVVAGNTYIARGLLRVISGTGACRLEIKTNADVLKFNSASFSGTGAWYEVSLEFTADATGTWRFKWAARDANVSQFFVTANLIEDTSLIPAGSSYKGRYFDGGSTFLHPITGVDTATWLGASGTSTSMWEVSTRLRELINGTPGTTLYGVKPAAVIIDYGTTLGGDWGTLLATHATWGEVLTDFTDWGDVLNNPTKT